MRKSFVIVMAICVFVVAGCAPDADETQPAIGSSSTNPVTISGSDEAGESVLKRTDDGIVLNIEACCAIPGNAYTAWWVIGDVELSMTSAAVESELATGFIAESERVDLELVLDAGPDGIENPFDGVRLVVLDHGPDNGDPKQLSTPEGGCTGMCPVVFRTSHAAP